MNWELVVNHLGVEPHLILDGVGDHCNVFHPQGATVGVYLMERPRPKATKLGHWPEVKTVGEGWALQSVASPRPGSANLRLLVSAPTLLRAEELLRMIALNFEDHFRPAKPKNTKQFIEDYIERRVNPDYANFAAAAVTEFIDFSRPSPVWREELQRQINGQVLSDDKTLDHYSTDGSIFLLRPWVVILPRDKADIGAAIRWLREKIKETGGPDERLSLTARGKATDQAGGPLNRGVILRFPDYLDKILEVGENFVRVEPGAIWSEVNDELAKKERFVPCYPASAKFATIGGGVANNCSGEKTVKYGSMRDYVSRLKMFVADGKEIEIRPFSHNEVIQKQAQRDREGEIYRRLYDLLVGNHNLIENHRPKVTKLSSGYWLWGLLQDDGIDPTKLICGSQGTLGIVSEIELRTIPKPPLAGLLLAAFANLEEAGKVILDLLQLRPSALEMVDKYVIAASPQKIFSEPLPALVLLIEFDGDDPQNIKNKIEAAKKILLHQAGWLREAYEMEEQEELWQIRRSAALVAEAGEGKKQALPFIEDMVVHPKDLARYLGRLYQILEENKVEFAVWGHAGNGNFHLQPFLDIGDETDREKLFRLSAAAYELTLSLGGMLSGEHNDGLMRSPFLPMAFGDDLYRIFCEIKKIFDPDNIFNPGKKVNLDWEIVKKYLRKEYHIPVVHGTTT